MYLIYYVFYTKIQTIIKIQYRIKTTEKLPFPEIPNANKIIYQVFCRILIK